METNVRGTWDPHGNSGSVGVAGPGTCLARFGKRGDETQHWKTHN